MEILDRAAYHVLHTRDATEALLVSRDYGGVLSLVVADGSALGVRSKRFMRELLQLRAGLKFVYLSGDSEDTQEGATARGSRPPLLRKPFTIEALMRTITDVLATR